MSDPIRASALQGFVALVRDLGGDPAPLLAHARLRPDVVGDSETYIPYRAAAAVLERAAVTLDCPDFGLRLSTRQGIEILGPVALIARHAATTADAILGIAQHLHIYSPAIAIALEDVDPSRTRFTFTILAARLPARDQANELSLGVALSILQLLIGTRYHPPRAYLPHAAISPPATYRRFFGCPVEFESELCGFDISSGDLARRRTADDPQMRELVTRYLETDAAFADTDLPAQIRHLITRTLPTGHASMTVIASHLGVHTRTLQRWLAAEGATFEAILDDVRRERAQHYLTRTKLPLSQIALMLGYTEQSSLTRAVQRWFGASPRALRATRLPARAAVTRRRARATSG